MKQGQTENLAEAAPGISNRYHLTGAVMSCIILLLLIAACSSTQQDLLPRKTTQITDHNTTSSSTTQPLTSISPTYTPIFTPSITQEKPTLTPTPIVDLISLIDLIHRDANPTNYRLVTPDSELLIQQINRAYQELLIARQVAMSTQPIEEGLTEDAETGLKAAFFEVEYHLRDGFPSPQQAFTIQLDPYFFGSDDYALVIPYYQAGFFDMLRDHQLSDQFSLQQGDTHFLVYQVELDGDSGKEWLAFVDAKQMGLFTWLKINSLPEGILQLMPSGDNGFSFITYLTDYPEIKAVQDFTGDGLTDFVLLSRYEHQYRNDLRFLVAQATPDGYALISTVETSSFIVTDGETEYEVLQQPDIGQITLTITDPINLNWDCTYDIITTYEWSGGEQRSSQEGIEPPLTAECYLAQAVTLGKPLNPDIDIPLLLQALALFTDDDPEDIPKIAFAHYRLAVLYALRHEDAQVRAHLEAFLDFNRLTGSELVETVDTEVSGLLSAPRLDPLTLCSWIAGTPYTYFPDWSIFTNETAAGHAYPLSNEISPRALCPWSQVVDWILESVTVVPGVSLANALTSAGLPVITAQSLWLPGWPEPAWLVLLQSDPYDLISYRPWEAENPWKDEVWFSPNSGEAIWLNQDVTGDGYPEIALAVPLLDYSGASTGTYEVWITSVVSAGIMVSETIYTNIPAGEQLDLAGFLADHNGDGLSDATIAEAELRYGTLPPLEPANPPIWPTYSEWSDILRTARQTQDPQEVEPEALSALFEGANPAETRAALSQLLKDSQSTDPATLLYRQRLLYLIGLSYEMEGQDDLAVATFIRVILADPETLWSALAACHLSPIE